ncbi:ABC transporter substrate-binding protein [Oscillibacter sp. MSJ-2]|uniref:ABC transporter substrate-binding protein n=1 Tax=Dysosmobacter acutus TaxID=2841504 RepID=A0ABS6FCR5_9FIRM|nr:ABC transporter substrate-binding protein [Dysosmobacter acutus]MBU5627957.1 ABC transporter substrate-binding protein [Dysosmobacter acutus]
MRRIRLSAVALAVVLLLSGCWSEGEVLPGDTTVIDSSEEPPETEEPAALPEQFALPYLPDQTLDPITCADGIQQTVGSLLYEGLFRLDETFSPQKSLCDEFSYNAEKLTFTFTLRTGVTFSDGSELTGADVAAQLNRARTSARYAARFDDVASITGSGSVVTVVLSSANTSLPSLLDIPIVKHGTEENTVPLGTGPYHYMTDENGPYLRANPAWWGGKSAPVERIELVESPDMDTTLYQFTSHEIQLITADLTGSKTISTTGSITFSSADTTIFQYVGLNTAHTLLSNAAVRRALGLGINRSTAVSAFLSGHGTPAQFPISPVSSLYPTNLERSYSYEDFESALNTAGLNSGNHHTLTMLVNGENPFKVSVARYIATSLSVHDLTVEVEALPWEEFTAALSAGQFDLYYGEVRLSPDWDLSSLIGTGGTLNYGRYSDITTDQMLSAYGAAADRQSAMEALCRHLQYQAPILPVCFKTTSVLTQADVVEGLSPTASDPFYGLEEWTIHLAQ